MQYRYPEDLSRAMRSLSEEDGNGRMYLRESSMEFYIEVLDRAEDKRSAPMICVAGSPERMHKHKGSWKVKGFVVNRFELIAWKNNSLDMGGTGGW